MKYHTKIYCALAGTALISSLSGFGILFFEFRQQVLLLIETQAITVAATTAVLIDGELLKEIRSPADENTQTYFKLKNQLILARNANRRQEIYINYLYTLKPNPDQPTQMICLVDAEEDPKNISHVGDINPISPYSHPLDHLTDYYSPGKFLSDSWGTTLSGFAPVYDKEGRYVATVGADVSIDRYLYLMHEMLQLFALGLLISFLFAFAGGALLTHRITVSLRTLLFCVREIGQGNLKCRASLKTHDEFEELADEVNNMTRGLREHQNLKLNFARYVSQHVMEKILTLENMAKLEGERRKITVLFSDIRKFTQLAEHMSPEKIVSFLNEYFEAMIDVIFQYEGTLDKFLGDGMMVEFGAPLDDAIQEKHAVLAAIEMQKTLKKLIEKWKTEGKPAFDMGIGIHTGFAIMGNIGSERRIEYTAIGDTVNVAAKIEQLTKSLKKPILISESTYNAVKGHIKATSLGPINLPGRTTPITIYMVDAEDYTIREK